MIKRIRITALLAACLLIAACTPVEPAAIQTPPRETAMPTAAADAQATPTPAPKPAPAEKAKGEIIPANDIDPYGGADSYANGGDNPASRYYVNMDFYNAQSDEMLIIIPGYKTYQQTTGWSCGNVTALTALYHFGIEDYTEWDIAVAMGSHTDLDMPGAQPGSANNFHEYGTNVRQMTEFFEGIEGLAVLETSYRADYKEENLLTEEDGVSSCYVGNLPGTFNSMSLYTNENDPASEAYVEHARDSYFVKWLTGHIEEGNVIMVEWADWDGHWTAIIGYDDNGTPGLGDDVLIFADPHDTADHWQDGYAIYPLERWFYLWNDRSVAPKPFQIQPYLVVGKEK